MDAKLKQKGHIFKSGTSYKDPEVQFKNSSLKETRRYLYVLVCMSIVYTLNVT